MERALEKWKLQLRTRENSQNNYEQVRAENETHGGKGVTMSRPS